MNKTKFKYLLLFVILATVLLLSACKSDNYNSTVKTEHQQVQAMVVANYCIEGEIRPVIIAGHIIRRYFPDEYITIVQYDYGNGYNYLELEIRDKSLYESVEIGDYVECTMITEIFETGQAQRLQYTHIQTQ